MTDTLNGRVAENGIDAEETSEWVESFDQLLAARGRERAADILATLRARAEEAGISPSRS